MNGEGFAYFRWDCLRNLELGLQLPCEGSLRQWPSSLMYWNTLQGRSNA